jgi:hypothetical protein
MEKPKTPSGRFRPAKDRFALAVYIGAGLLACVELLALFWLDLI